MSTNTQQTMSAVALIFILAIQVCVTVLVAYSLRSQQRYVEELAERVDHFRLNHSNSSPQSRPTNYAHPFFEGATVTLASAVFQQRVERAVSEAGGQLSSLTNEVGARGDESGIALVAELTITQLGMQALLYNLESGSPYIFVDLFEAQVAEPGNGEPRIHVLMRVSGQWKSQVLH